VRVVIEVFHDIRSRTETLDIFGLEFVDHEEHVAGMPFEDGEEGAVACGAIGADHHFWKLTRIDLY
jgi:hypothetical protein